MFFKFLKNLDNLVTRSRVIGYGVILVTGYFLAGLYLLFSAHGGVDRNDKPIGYDFLPFYAASRMILHGDINALWTPEAIMGAERRVVPNSPWLFPWHYPPPFALIVTPLALLPYVASYLVGMAATLAAFVAFLRRLMPSRGIVLVTLAFPGTFMNLFDGQNGFLNTVIMGSGLLSLDRRPWLGGAILGLLVYKPHLILLMPFLLIASGRWAALGGTVLSALFFVIASLAAFGIVPWLAFFHDIPWPLHLLEAGTVPWAKMPVIFVSLRELGVPQGIAFMAHGAVALIIAGATLHLWRRPGPFDLKAAMAVLATLFISPYLFDYDLVLLAVPIALLARRALGGCALPPGTKAALALGFFTPAIFLPVALWLHLQLMPLGLLILTWFVWRTALSDDKTALP